MTCSATESARTKAAGLLKGWFRPETNTSSSGAIKGFLFRLHHFSHSIIYVFQTEDKNRLLYQKKTEPRGKNCAPFDPEIQHRCNSPPISIDLLLSHPPPRHPATPPPRQGARILTPTPPKGNSSGGSGLMPEESALLVTGDAQVERCVSKCLSAGKGTQIIHVEVRHAEHSGTSHVLCDVNFSSHLH